MTAAKVLGDKGLGRSIALPAALFRTLRVTSAEPWAAATVRKKAPGGTGTENEEPGFGCSFAKEIKKAGDTKSTSCKSSEVYIATSWWFQYIPLRGSWLRPPEPTQWHLWSTRGRLELDLLLLWGGWGRQRGACRGWGQTRVGTNPPEPQLVAHTAPRPPWDAHREHPRSY